MVQSMHASLVPKQLEENVEVPALGGWYAAAEAKVLRNFPR